MGRRMSDNEIERIVAGESTGDPALDDLSRLAAEIATPDDVDPALADRHVSAAAAAAAAAAPDTPPATDPPRVRWHRRLVMRSVASGLVANIVLGTAIAIAATGGPAATGLVDLFEVDDRLVERSLVVVDDDHVSTTTTGPSEDSSAIGPTSTTTSSTTTSTTAAPSTTQATTSTTSAGDDGEGDFQLVAGDRRWQSTSCDGSSISVDYRITEDGALEFGSVEGQYDDLEVRSDRIRVEFDDGVEVDIQVDDDALTVEEDRSCDGETTTTTGSDDEGDDDEHGGESTTTTEPDED